MDARKRMLRDEMRQRRRALTDRPARSQAVWKHVFDLPEYRAATTVMCYVDFASEVRTQRFLAAALGGSKRIVVPYCLGDQLQLFLLERMEELAPGTYGILEPRVPWRSRQAKRVEAAELDLVIVPGVAFDRRGARLGNGKGYYDRFLVRVRPDAPLVALAFECQLFAEIPTQPHDVSMNQVITEEAVYPS